MTKEVELFKFVDEDVRIVRIEGEPWFVAKDVCDILGIKNSRDAISKLFDDEKMTVANTDSHSGKRGGAQFMSLISESGLYALIFQSKKSEARAFSRWVTHVVLPQIRKTGKYEATEKAHEVEERDKLSRVETEKWRDARGNYVMQHHVKGFMGELDIRFTSQREVYLANDRSWFEIVYKINELIMLMD